MIPSSDRAAAALTLLAGSFLLVGGILIPLNLLEPEPTLPGAAGPVLETFAARHGGNLLVALLLALTGAGIATGTSALASRLRLLGPGPLDQMARWGFAAGVLWVLRAVFLVTVRGAWALRYAGTLEPANRRELLVALWPLMRQVDWFFQWSAAVLLGIAFAWGGALLVRWPGRLRLAGTFQLLAALSVATALTYVLPVHYPRRFAAPGFPTQGVYWCAVLIYETAALALLAAGFLLWYGSERPEVEEEGGGQ